MIREQRSSKMGEKSFPMWSLLKFRSIRNTEGLCPNWPREGIAPRSRRHRVGDAVEVGGAGGPEDERDTVEEEAGGKGPDQQVLPPL